MRWAVLAVNCPSESVEAVSYAMIHAGCGGTMMTGEEPVLVEGSLPDLSELAARLAALRAHLARLPEFGLPAMLGDLQVRFEEEEDWANAWKRYYKPVRLGRRLVVKPSWEEFAAGPEDLIIELDPGMAFGTGGHPTTTLCLKTLEDYVRPGMRVADIGTGSGILAIAAAKLGAAEVYATDIDALARKIAAENIARNGLSDRVRILDMGAFDEAALECDLICANIVAGVIVELAPSLPPRLKPGGLFIASGIVEEYSDRVLEAMDAAGFDAVETRTEDIWVCHTGRLRSDAVRGAIEPITRSDYHWNKLT